MQLPIPFLRGGLGIPLGFGTGWKKLLCEQIRVSIIHHMKLFRSTRVQRDILVSLEKISILESRSLQGPSRGNRVQRDISRS